MKSPSKLCLVSSAYGLLLLLASCVSPCNSFGVFMLYPLAVFNPLFYAVTYHGHDGSGPDHAVVLNGPKGERETAEAESAYIYKKFDVDSERAQRQTEKGGGRTYHVVRI